MAKQKEVTPKYPVFLPDRQMTDDELIAHKAGNRVSATNTDTRGHMIETLVSDYGYTVIPPDGNAVNSYQFGTPLFLGKGRYKIGSEVICLDGAEANVLQALVELQAGTMSDLTRRGGSANPSAVLKRICDKYPSLAKYIKLPGGKSRGGYSTTIVARISS